MHTHTHAQGLLKLYESDLYLPVASLFAPLHSATQPLIIKHQIKAAKLKMKMKIEKYNKTQQIKQKKKKDCEISQKFLMAHFNRDTQVYQELLRSDVKCTTQQPRRQR